MISKKVLALVLAGGRGSRLGDLTREHAKPALPFSGGYRIIDFVLSNLFNSQISTIYVLAQYKPHSLIEHLTLGWGLSSLNRRDVLEVVLPGRMRRSGFKGTADAVYQNLHLIDHHDPDVVAVFAADHIYRMDVRQMIDFHTSVGADVSVAAVPVPVQEACSFGIIGADVDGRIRQFQEKPLVPHGIAAKPGYAYASMGNYLFKPEVLVAALREANERAEEDFGHHVLPRLSAKHRAYAYDFTRNRIPGVNPYEEVGYWRDVGTIEAYRAAQRDIIGTQPRFQLWNPDWPIHGRPADRSAAVTHIDPVYGAVHVGQKKQAPQANGLRVVPGQPGRSMAM